jgi:hypothetical protein
MDYFGTDSMVELFACRGEPRISLYMPTFRRGARAEENIEQFRELVGQIDELLDEEDRALRQRLEELASDGAFWRAHDTYGLVVLMTEGFERILRLPEPFTPIAVVGPSFHTRPLLDYLNSPDRFYLLGLTQRRARLWSGNRRALFPVEVEGMPEPPSPPVSSTTPSVDSVEPAKLEDLFHTFFREVDAALCEFLKHQPVPVILATSDYFHPLYSRVTSLHTLADSGIVGDIFALDEGQLRDLAVPIVQRAYATKISEALEEWTHQEPLGRASSSLEEVAHAAAEGRVRLMLVESQRHIWGSIDPQSGEVDVIKDSGPDPSKEAIDLLDELCEMILLQGGKNLVVPSRQMPTDTGVAAIFRA